MVIKPAGCTFDRNIYCGNGYISADVNRIRADANVVCEGIGERGFNTLEGYKLLANSPAIGQGNVIQDNGCLDLFGNIVTNATKPNIGAYNGDGLFVGNNLFESGNASPWTKCKSRVVNNNQYSGNYCGYVEAGGSLEQTVYGLQPNTTYRLKGFVKVQNKGDNLLFGVKYFGGDQIAVSTNSDDYSQKELTFTTGANNTSAIIFLHRPSDTGSGKGFGDEIFIEKLEE